jgi:hypothetical protein
MKLYKKINNFYLNTNCCWRLNDTDHNVFRNVNKKYALQLCNALDIKGKYTNFLIWNKFSISNYNIIQYKLFNTLLRYQETYPDFLKKLPENFNLEDLYNTEITLFKRTRRNSKAWISNQLNYLYKSLPLKEILTVMNSSTRISNFNFKLQKLSKSLNENKKTK